MHKLTAARLDKGLTIEQLHQESGVRAATISRIEHSHNQPRASTLMKLSKVLDVRPSQLVGEVPETPSAIDPELEQALAGLEGLEDEAEISAYALAWAGEGPDALIRLDKLAKAIEWERPFTYWVIRATFYSLGAEMVASGEITAKEARKTEASSAA